MEPRHAWGFDGLPPLVLVGGRGLAVLFLLYLVAKTSSRRPALVGALVLILAGAIGNLYDNVMLEPRLAGRSFGEVRDFIDVYFGLWDWHFPTFNVADSCISVGAALLFVSGFGRSEGAEESESEPAPAT